VELPPPRKEISDQVVVRGEGKDEQVVEKDQDYSNCHAELVSASNEFNALGDPETSSG
jgi:hypothetical protein